MVNIKRNFGKSEIVSPFFVLIKFFLTFRNMGGEHHRLDTFSSSEPSLDERMPVSSAITAWLPALSAGRMLRKACNAIARTLCR